MPPSSRKRNCCVPEIFAEESAYRISRLFSVRIRFKEIEKQTERGSDGRGKGRVREAGKEKDEKRNRNIDTISKKIIFFQLKIEKFV